ncbi:MAG: LON peptidase substrate-binding domain-containing protein [Pirellulales bacterium]|nr:LON peptidase substrate-binding domain-containing protein [Pirellulales bacterium]
MSEFTELNLSPPEFNGVARLFPIPNVVLFPHVMQPLHIFEPRYREMVASAMATDRSIAIATFEPGWEDDYEGRPPVNRIACLGHIAACSKLEDGRYDILLLGRQRIELTEELPPLRLFREAQANFIEDIYSDDGAGDRDQRQEVLIDAFRQVLPDVPKVLEQLDELLRRSVPLGTLADIFAYTIDIPFEVKQQLLMELDVDRRAAQLLTELRALGQRSSNKSRAVEFPPRFSIN